jgi:hypothetical protein
MMMATTMIPGTDPAIIMALITLTILPTTLGAAIIGAEDGVAVGEIGDGIAVGIGIITTAVMATTMVDMVADTITKGENL